MKHLHLNFRLSYLSFVVILIGFVGSAFGQGKVAGQVFTKAEADQLFGPVLKTVTVSVDDLNKILDKCGDGYVMLDVDISSAQPQPIATDSERRLLNGYATSVKPERVMHKYSKSKVQELLSKSGLATSSSTLQKSTASSGSTSGATVSLEVRANVFTVSTTTYTLEMAILCPPFCEK
jgi:Flp pilus assembly protein TadG